MKEEIILTPYVGMTDFNLYSSFDDCKKKVKDLGIKYRIDIWENKGCTPEVEWKIIRLENGINLFFAKEKLFKIYVVLPFIGSLNNGIRLGMTLKECLKIDPKLFYNDDFEGFESPNGYWIEENLNTDVIETITIFIKELEDDDIFDSFSWAECK